MFAERVSKEACDRAPGRLLPREESARPLSSSSRLRPLRVEVIGGLFSRRKPRAQVGDTDAAAMWPGRGRLCLWGTPRRWEVIRLNSTCSRPRCLRAPCRMPLGCRGVGFWLACLLEHFTRKSKGGLGRWDPMEFSPCTRRPGKEGVSRRARKSSAEWWGGMLSPPTEPRSA